MRALMISAMQSGAGKTVLTCALIRALQNAGLAVEAFKCGPDYLDPMFHRRVLGTPCNNLDLFLQGDAGVHRTLGSSRADIAVIEAAMGFYDGVSGTDQASAWQIAAQEDIPVVLAVHPQGSSLTLAAQLQGLLGFRVPNNIVGVILTHCKPSLAAHLTPLIEHACDISVVGYLPPMDEASFASRHLGLVTAPQIPDFEQRIDAIAAMLCSTCKLDALIDLSQEVRPATYATSRAPSKCRIGVARDEAFCFYYDSGLARLQELGAELVNVSPLHDTELPPVDALYLGGGYPELHARQLAANHTMRHTLLEALHSGMPTVAECGGFLYLQEELIDAEGMAHPMVGSLSGQAFPAGQLVRFGYAHLYAKNDSLLLRAGEQLPTHEFHHWDSTNNGEDLTACKPSGRTWRCCHVRPSLYAGFPHLHFAGELPLASRFVEAAIRYGGV